MNKVFTLVELCEIVATHVGLKVSDGWDVHIDFNKNKDNYIFKFTEQKNE